MTKKDFLSLVFSSQKSECKGQSRHEFLRSFGNQVQAFLVGIKGGDSKLFCEYECKDCQKWHFRVDDEKRLESKSVATCTVCEKCIYDSKENAQKEWDIQHIQYFREYPMDIYECPVGNGWHLRPPSEDILEIFKGLQRYVNYTEELRREIKKFGFRSLKRIGDIPFYEECPYGCKGKDGHPKRAFFTKEHAESITNAEIAKDEKKSFGVYRCKESRYFRTRFYHLTKKQE